MQLSDKLIQSFSEVIKSAAPNEKGQNPTVMGTVSRTDNGVMVTIDGSDSATPATTLVGVDVGDRVDVLIQNHRAIITGNRSAPAITRSNQTYMKMTEDGLVIGLLDDAGEPSGTYLLVSPTGRSFRIIDPSEGVVASFGETTQIGGLNSAHVGIDDTTFYIYDSSGNPIASFGEQVVIGPGGEALHTITNDSGFNILKNGKVVATFGTFAQIGAADTIHAMVEQNGFVLRDGSGNVLASFGTTANIGKTDGIHVAINSSGMSVVSPTGEVLATFGSETNIKRLETDALLVEKTNDEARAVVRAYSGTTVAAEGRLVATAGTSRFGLYDGKHSKWLINSESDGKVTVSLDPVKLSSKEYTATAISTTTYVNAPIANMSQWSVIVAYVGIGNDYASFTFIKGGPTYQTASSHNGTTVVRASVIADWTNDRLRLCCVDGTGTLYNTVHLRDVYGIVKA